MEQNFSVQYICINVLFIFISKRIFFILLKLYILLCNYLIIFNTYHNFLKIKKIFKLDFRIFRFFKFMINIQGVI